MGYENDVHAIARIMKRIDEEKLLGSPDVHEMVAAIDRVADDYDYDYSDVWQDAWDMAFR